jgi:hypothetical protein
MDCKEFKNLFNEVVKANDFKKAFGGWYKESQECIVILQLSACRMRDAVVSSQSVLADVVVKGLSHLSNIFLSVVFLRALENIC